MTENTNDLLLQFSGGSGYPVQYEATYNGDHYYIRYRFGWLSVDKNDTTIYEFDYLGAEDGGYWSDQETNVFLHLISHAIVSNTLNTLILPTTIDETHSHRLFKRGEHPKYIRYTCGQEHEHTNSCSYESVAAKDLDEISKINNDRFYQEYILGRKNNAT